MQKVITPLCVCSTFILLNAAITATLSNHLQELHIHYPYGLLGEDYGILNVDDLAMNTCEIIKPEPFSTNSNAYPYWQCFPLKDVHFSCESSGYDEWTKSTPSILVIAISAQNNNQEYLSRRSIDFEDCKDFEKRWKRITTKERYVCLSGQIIDIKINTQKEKETTWIFDKLKTKKGCVSYFQGECNLQHHLKNGCKPKP